MSYDRFTYENQNQGAQQVGRPDLYPKVWGGEREKEKEEDGVRERGREGRGRNESEKRVRGRQERARQKIRRESE